MRNLLRALVVVLSLTVFSAVEPSNASACSTLSPHHCAEWYGVFEDQCHRDYQDELEACHQNAEEVYHRCRYDNCQE